MNAATGFNPVRLQEVSVAPNKPVYSFHVLKVISLLVQHLLQQQVQKVHKEIKRLFLRFSNQTTQANVCVGVCVVCVCVLACMS